MEAVARGHALRQYYVAVSSMENKLVREKAVCFDAEKGQGSSLHSPPALVTLPSPLPGASASSRRSPQLHTYLHKCCVQT